MKLWIDEQLSPALADWIRSEFGLDARHVRELDLRAAPDPVIFAAARRADVVVVTKDQDFVRLLDAHGPPPRLIWITCGNTSNARMRQVLRVALVAAVDLIGRGEALVEISDSLG